VDYFSTMVFLSTNRHCELLDVDCSWRLDPQHKLRFGEYSGRDFFLRMGPLDSLGSLLVVRYRKGFRGVLVEPNFAMCQKIRVVRPEDTTLEAGISVTGVREADYYMMSESTWNILEGRGGSHDQGDGRPDQGRKGHQDAALDINEVMVKHFGKAPAYVSIDAEGLHLAILKSIDYGRFRPLAICVETLVAGSRAAVPEIPPYVATQSYVDRRGSFVNTIFVDGTRI
jgi:hypothetical protein